MQNDGNEMMGTALTFTPWGLFAEASPLMKVVMLVVVAAGVVAAVAAIARKSSGGPRSSLLALAGQVGLYGGVGGGGYEAMTAWMTANQMHITRFAVIEPDIIEAVFVLLLGLIVWLIARYGNAGGKRA